jgi:NAD(P) transhydrogenase subunit alpha
VEGAQPGKVVDVNGVKIVGLQNLPGMVPVHASQMYSKNITNLFRHLYQGETFDFEDEITKESCLTHDGKIVNNLIADLIERGGKKNE